MNHIFKKEINDILKNIFSSKIKDIEKLPDQALTVIIGCIFKVYSQWPQYVTNADRLASFAHWNVEGPTVDNLANAGLFCISSKTTKTICIACNTGFCDWKSTDDALDEHRSHAPLCPFLLVLDLIYRPTTGCSACGSDVVICQTCPTEVSKCANQLEPLLNGLINYVPFSASELSAVLEVEHSADLVLLAAFRYSLCKQGRLPSNVVEILRSVSDLEDELELSENENAAAEFACISLPRVANLFKYWCMHRAHECVGVKQVPYRKQRGSVSRLSGSEDQAIGHQ